MEAKESVTAAKAPKRKRSAKAVQSKRAKQGGDREKERITEETQSAKQEGQERLLRPRRVVTIDTNGDVIVRYRT
jgi:hypothetical protein